MRGASFWSGFTAVLVRASLPRGCYLLDAHSRCVSLGNLIGVFGVLHGHSDRACTMCCAPHFFHPINNCSRDMFLYVL